MSDAQKEGKEKQKKKRRHFDSEGDVEMHAGALSAVIVPVVITFVFVLVVVLLIGAVIDEWISLIFPGDEKPQVGFCTAWGPAVAPGSKPGEVENDTWKIVLISIAVAGGFVILIVIMTFVILCCYFKGHTCFVFGWLGLATALLLGLIGGTIFFLILDRLSVPLDYITFMFFILNFAVFGVISVFVASPLFIQQIMLIFVSVFMAWAVLGLPEWTTWILLVAVAIYDIFAVLCSCCALNKLVEISEERNEPIPGLVYTATVDQSRVNRIRGEVQQQKQIHKQKNQKKSKHNKDRGSKEDERKKTPLEETSPSSSSSSSAASAASAVPTTSTSPTGCVSPTFASSTHNNPAHTPLLTNKEGSSNGGEEADYADYDYSDEEEDDNDERSEPEEEDRGGGGGGGGGGSGGGGGRGDVGDEGGQKKKKKETNSHTAKDSEYSTPKAPSPEPSVTTSSPSSLSSAPANQPSSAPSSQAKSGIGTRAGTGVQGQPKPKKKVVKRDDGDDNDTLRLGLGDFVFYSVLLARAALTDWTSTIICGFCILFGLCMTVILLAIWRRALPALPVSIFISTGFYFASRYIISVFVLRLSYLTQIL